MLNIKVVLDFFFSKTEHHLLDGPPQCWWQRQTIVQTWPEGEPGVVHQGLHKAQSQSQLPGWAI